jgi:FixJ family two-component response regulator
MSRDTTGREICLLDDDVGVLTGVERLLRSAGFAAVEKFECPHAFLGTIEQAPPRVVISDVYMPTMTGLEVQAILREKAPATKLILMSGRIDPSLRLAAMNAGALAFLPKPLDDELLLEQVSNALSR